MDFICIFFGIAFCIFGAAFALGKIHIHLSFWKTMSQEEKEKIKIVPLCRNIGEMVLLNGIIFLLKGVWTDFSDHWFLAVMTAWIIIACFDVWHISKSGRYQNKGIGGRDQ